MLVTTALVVLITSGCGAWVRQGLNEHNRSFRIADNLLFLRGLTVEGRSGNYAIASSLPETILSEEHESLLRDGHARVSSRGSAGVSITPELYPLDDRIDGLIGLDVLGPVLVIDYRYQLATTRRVAAFEEPDLVHAYAGQPSLPIDVDGHAMVALVDTANPDSLHVPAEWVDESASEAGARVTRRVSIGEIPIGEIDLLLVERGPARIGNRLLSLFVVGIDQNNRQVALWRE